MNKKKLLRLTAIAPLLSLTLSMAPVKIVNAEPIDDVRFYLKNYYYKDISSDILSKGSIEEIIKDLNDPYTTYMSDEEYDAFVNYINNSVCGIGVYMDEHKDGLEIYKLIDGGPASKGGVVVGDVVTKIDGKSIKGMGINEASSLLRGTEGSKVTLSYKRSGITKTAELIREEIVVPTISYDVLDDKIGYIKIESFGEKTAYEFQNAIRNLNKLDVESFIFDLRYNSGGFVSTALDMAGSFIKNNLVMQKRTKDGAIKEENGRYNPLKPYIDKPNIILINEHSASASEILAAALKDFDKSCFIGQTTFGKGVAQSIVDIKDGGKLKFTKEEFRSPKGLIIHERGITPHILLHKNVDPLLVSRMLLNDNLFLSRNSNEELEMVQDNIDFTDLKFNGFYFNCEVFGELKDVSPTKTYKVTFEKEVSEEEAKKNIRLLNGVTGEEVKISYKISGNVVEVKPEKSLARGGSYILIVNDDMRSTDEGKLKEGAMTFITVKE